MAGQHYCPECGKEVDDDQSFCVSCGANLADREPPPPAPEAPTEKIDRPATPPPPPPPPPPSKAPPPPPPPPRHEEPETPADEEPAPVYPPPPPSAAPEPPAGNRRWIIGGIVGVVAVLLIAGGAFLLLSGGDDADTASGPTQSLDSVLNGETDSGTTDGGFFPDEGTGSDSTSTEPNVQSQNPKPKPKPPVQRASDLGTSCGGGVAVNSVTTCPFAKNVAAEYRASNSSSVSAYSPARDQYYDMTCTPGPPAVCRGGDDAAVYVDD